MKQSEALIKMILTARTVLNRKREKYFLKITNLKIIPIKQIRSICATENNNLLRLRFGFFFMIICLTRLGPNGQGG